MIGGDKNNKRKKKKKMEKNKKKEKGNSFNFKIHLMNDTSLNKEEKRGRIKNNRSPNDLENRYSSKNGKQQKGRSIGTTNSPHGRIDKTGRYK